jgi:transcriptional regulator with XRE-family HTH domain
MTPTLTASPDSQPSSESDELAKRISEVLGNRRVSGFARECGFGESLLRKYLTGTQPSTANLVAIARAGGVTVDWLATGREPKTSLSSPDQRPPTEDDGLAKRIAEVLGNRRISGFAKECGFAESLLRKYLAGGQPGTANLVAIARAGGVTVDWLATGREPKTLEPVEESAELSLAGAESNFVLPAGHRLESDAFVARMKEVIGERKLTWFASECGVGESTLRNILSGAWPRTDILAAIARAGGVTLDWLATGREPKTRVSAVREAPKGGFDDRRAVLEAVLRVAEAKIGRNEIDRPAIEAALVGAPSWLAIAKNYPDLEPRLQSVLATLRFFKVTMP